MNKVRLLSKITLAASVSLALAFTFSCSSDSNNSSDDENSSSSSVDNGSNVSSSSDGSGNSSSSSSGGGSSSSSSGGNGNTQISNEITKSYPILSQNSGSFKFQFDDQYHCTENGAVVSTRTVDYSIANNILVWKEEDISNDTLNFSGTSNNIIGTWTRTKDKNASCKLETYDNYQWYECKESWYFTKAVITENTLDATLDYCGSDEYVDGSDDVPGWRIRITGCNTFESYKGSDVIKIEETLSGGKVSYGNQTCILDYSADNQIEACNNALLYASDPEDIEDYYWDFIYYDYANCIYDMLPDSYLSAIYSKPYSGKVSAKQAAKDPLNTLEKFKNSKFYPKKRGF